MRGLCFVLLTGGLCAAAPLSAEAAEQTISASFSIAVPATPVPSTDDSPGRAEFYSTAFPLFSSAYGSLDSVTIALAGSISWASIAKQPYLFLYLTPSYTSAVVYSDTFFQPDLGTIQLNVSASPSDLADYVGTGNSKFLFAATSLNPTNANVIGSDGGLTGTITYDYTPALTTTPGAPEAPTWALMLLGFGGLGYAAFRRSAGGAAASVAAGDAGR